MDPVFTPTAITSIGTFHGPDHRKVRAPQDGLVRRPRPWHYRARPSAGTIRTWYDWLRCGYGLSVGREKDSLSS